MQPPIGIDLGTTYSAIAVWEGDGPRVLPTCDGRTLPSVVAYRADGSVIVGREAKKLQAEGDPNVVSFVKRNMGRPNYGFPAHGRPRSPVEVSAEILKALKSDGEKALGCPITEAVITVPAYFDDARRADTIAAGEAAGLRVLRLLDEPTSATLAFKVMAAQAGAVPLRGKVLVYDLGGGTFDVSVVDLHQSAEQVEGLGFDGDPYLGGKDFDDKLVMLVAHEVRNRHQVDLLDGDRLSSAWAARIEPFKIRLSSEDTVEIPYVAGSESGTVTVTRAQYEAACRAVLDRTKMLAEKALGDTKLGWRALQDVLLVGGMTRSPMVVRMLQDLLGKAPRADVNPDESVALGAAVAAAIEAGVLPADMLSEVTAHTLGVIAVTRSGDQYVNSAVLRKGHRIPATSAPKGYLVTTQLGDTNEKTLFITQGEPRDPRSAGLKFLPKRRVRNIPHSPETGRTKIAVTIGYDRSSTVTVTARLADGTELPVVVEPTTLDDIDRIRAGPTPGSAPVTTILAVDVSSSMVGPKLTGVQAAATDFIARRTNPDSRIGLVAFNENASVLCPPTNNTNQVCSAVAALRASGSTRFAPALAAARRLLQGAAGVRRVILLTDGGTGDKPDTNREVGACRAEGIAIHIIATQDAEQAYLATIGDTFTGTTDAGLGQALMDIPIEPTGSGEGPGDPKEESLVTRITEPPPAENLFLALDAPPATTAAELTRKLAEKQQEWSRNVNHPDPAVKTAANFRLDQVSAFERIITDPARLVAEAEEATRLRKEQEAERLREADRLIARYGAAEKCLTPAELARVAAATQLSEARVRELVKEHGYDIVQPPVPPPWPVLGPAEHGEIRNLLAQLHLPDLYAFLGGKPNDPGELLAAAASKEYNRLAQEGATTPVSQARKELCAIAQRVFADPDHRLRYNNSHAFAAMEPAREAIVARGGENKRLSFDDQAAIRIELKDKWPDDTAVDAFLWAVAQKAGLHLDKRKRTGQTGQIPVRCPNCQALNDTTARKCRKCPYDFYFACPKCQSANHFQAPHCERCGLNLKQRLTAENHARAAERAFEAGDLKEAADQAAQALELWPGLAKAKRVQAAVQQKLRTDGELRAKAISKIKQAIQEKRYVTAVGEVARVPDGDDLRKLRGEAEAGLAAARARHREGEQHLRDGNPDRAYAAFQEASSLCVDLPEPQEALLTCPAEPAGRVTVTLDKTGAAFAWERSPSTQGRISYDVQVVETGRGSDPVGPPMTAEVAEARCFFTLRPGAEYRATVLAKRNGRAALRHSEVTSILLPAEVTDIRVVAGPETVNLTYTPPPNVSRVEVFRAVGRAPVEFSPNQRVVATSNGYLDRQVTKGEHYHYLIRTVWVLSDKREVSSPGIRAEAVPAEKAPMVDKLDIAVSPSRSTAKVTFTPPKVGSALLYVGPAPANFPPGTALAESDLSQFGTAVPAPDGTAEVRLKPGAEVFFTVVSRNGGSLTVGATHPAMVVEPVRDFKVRYGIASGELAVEFPWPRGADLVRVSCRSDPPTDGDRPTMIDVKPTPGCRIGTCQPVVSADAEKVRVFAVALAHRPAVVGLMGARSYQAPETSVAAGGARRTLVYTIRAIHQTPPDGYLTSGVERIGGLELVIVPDSPTCFPPLELRYSPRSRLLAREEGRVVRVPDQEANARYTSNTPFRRMFSLDQALDPGEFRLFPVNPTDALGWRLLEVALPSPPLSAQPPAAVPRRGPVGIICPTCGHSFTPKEAQWRDYHAPKVECTEMAQALGVQTLPQVHGLHKPGFFGGAPATRNTDRYKKVCPRCLIDLPDLIADGKHQSLRFTFVAATYAGKSNFFTTLVHYLKVSSLPKELGITLMPATTYDLATCLPVSSQDLWERDYESHLYPAVDRNGQRPAPRAVPKTTRVGARPPLIFRLQVHQPGNGPHVIRPVDLLFYDTSGERFRNDRDTEQCSADILTSDGLIFLMDPLVCPTFQQMAGRLDRDTDPKGPLDMVYWVRRELEKKGRLSPSEQVGMDAAFVLGKEDLLRPAFVRDNPHAPGLLPADHRGGLDLIDIATTSADVKEYLRRSSLGALVPLVEGNFVSHQFFAASALGRAPSGDQHELDGPPEPHRVAEPLFWLLHRHGLLARKPLPRALTATRSQPVVDDEDDS